MKKVVLLFCSVAFTMISCTLSNEEKAERLITEYLKAELCYPDSYEPITTIIDSTCIDVSTIDTILGISEEIKDLLGIINGLENKYKIAIATMNLWTPNDNSFEYVINNYERAVNEKTEAQSDLELYSKKLSEQLESLKCNVAISCKDKFTGWIVIHKYNALNKYGLTPIIPNQDIFFCDEEFTSCNNLSPSKFIEFQDIIELINKSESDDEIITHYKDKFFIYPF